MRTLPGCIRLHRILPPTILLLAGLLIAGPLRAAEDLFALALGGRAYDNWMGLLTDADLQARGLDKQAFLGSHPAYPKDGQQKGLTTWRCKECHGWDYQGAVGAYGQGSHRTGIGGIRHFENRDPAAVLTVIRDATHRYTVTMIDDPTARALALFVSRGQVDMDQYIDRTTRRFRGDPARGAPHFEAICAICHGLDGRKINFKTVEKPEYLGTVANDNPWESFHKIRNGHPGKEMVSMRAIPVQSQVDILAHAQQRLPVR
ncbi:MAG: hypothetical protein HQL82_16340 [Magnetococcales bacterium]|nr:hypothetical protein [Magnetococcales bacterium]